MRRRWALPLRAPILTDRLESLLRRGLAADPVPDWPVEELAAKVMRRRRQVLRRRLALSSAAAAVCVCAMLGAWLTTGFGARLSTNNTRVTTQPLTTSALPTASPTTSIAPLVGAYGEIVHEAGRVPMLCDPGGAPALMVLRNDDMSGSQDSFPPTCIVSLTLAGLPASELPPVGAMKPAYVEGRLDNGVLTVTKVEATDPFRQNLDNPPCPAPHGGWPQGTNLNLDPLTAYQQAHPQTVIAAATFRPGGTGLALVVAATDAAAVRTALAPTYGRALCVVESRYSAQQVSTAADRLRQMFMDDEIPGELGVGSVAVGADGQPVLSVKVTEDTAAVRRALSAFPAGLVAVDAWLHSVPPEP